MKLPPPRLSRVVFNRQVAPGWYVLRLAGSEIARTARPGQFVQVRCAGGESEDPLLRRPFSVYFADRKAGTYDILYTVVGRGTRWMAALSSAAPQQVDVEGPFGNTFSPPEPEDTVYLVGGGVGVAPLYFLARELLGHEDESPARRSGAPGITLCMGARTRSLLAGIEDFRKLPVNARVATDDGSEGFHGLVTELLVDLLRGESDLDRVRVYGCGPRGMNESLRALLVERGIRGEICLESLMACGFGICFGCVAPIRKDPEGEYYMRRVCWEGPVFDARLLHPGIEG